MISLEMATAAIPPLVQTVPKGIGGTSFSVQNLISIIATVFSGGTLVALLRVLVIWKKTKDTGEHALRKLESEEDSSLRSDLLRLLAETRTDHANQIAEIRKEQAQERQECTQRLSEMQVQIDGLVRQLVAFQVSSGRAMGFTPESVAAADRVLDVMAKKGEAE